MSETNNISDNKRIAKNTILLYFRMLFTMGVTLFTSRVVLNTLGVEGYGIYNVTGGIIAMFAFLNTAMSSATQRYITFLLGKGQIENLKIVFSTSLQIHAIISVLIIILGETVGLWFLMEKLVIPEYRMTAAMWVYQCSIFATVVSIMSVPYNAAIVAHEKMSAFAYISVLEVSMKLLIVYLLVVSPWDKLIVYSVLLLFIQILIRFIYAIYCRKHFEESTYHHVIDKPLLKDMSEFAGWSFFGNFAAVLYTQGQNMMLNIFFGPIVNAARGIAVQVEGAIQQFAGSFQMAINPQITKNYASGNLSLMHSLMFRAARFSFYLLFLIALPVILETNYILNLWLKTVPEHTAIFVQIMLCITLLNPLSSPCSIANQATGNVKVFQAIVGGFLILILPISYVALSLGAPAYSVFIVHFFMEGVAQLGRMIMLRKQINLPLISYLKNIYYPISRVVIFSLLFPLFIQRQFGEGFIRLFVVGITCIISVSSSIYAVGLSKNERALITGKVIAKLKKH
ncbi:lipopolysaccharide biosynthesis protein [uncultured Bacteroides sp.]|uniref:lipopolysaccharide biosynthesis protein n=1 Tax=uncultured Bacteroides sp. TaxID=162156 RepID=UPI002AA6EEF8|nr:lipopolysaccharide biosynthesis protein [uncultured Bacteroides sp.]